MPNPMILANAVIVTHKEVFSNAYIVIDEKGMIKEIGKGEPGRYQGEKIDLEGRYVFPGYIDTHIHGFKGIEASLAKASDLYRMSREIARHGVTSIVPTLVSSPHDKTIEFCETISQAIDDQRHGVHGARILGAHLEGPYISKEKKGAHNPEYIREPDIDELNEYIERSGGKIIQITIAPELDNALKLISHATARNIVASIGHTNATYEQTLKAIDAGASKATHILNAMPSIHHRSPGAVVALLQSRNVFIEIIVDFIHIHPAVVKIIVDYVSPSRTVLISDSIAATGLKDGRYRLGDLDVEVVNGIPRIAGTDTIAGSTLTLDQAVRNMHRLGYGLTDLATISSYIPALSINAAESYGIGVLEKGYKADLAILNEKLEVDMTIVDGEIVYRRI